MNKTKRKLACFSLAVLMLGTIGASAASNMGTVAYNKAGIISNHKTIVKPGASITAADGESIPSVITYTDAQGKDTNYLSLRQISELFDIPITWDSEKNSVVLGSENTKRSLVITEGGPENMTAEDKSKFESELVYTVYDEPVYGIQAGGFTETDPAKIPADAKRENQTTYKKTYIANSQLNEEEGCTPGATTRISFTNHSTETQSVYIIRQPHGSLSDVELFSKVRIEPEQTVTRAFYLEKDASPFARSLTWCMAGGTVTNVDVVVDSFWGKFE